MKIYDNVGVVTSLVPAIRTTDTTGTSVIDTQGYRDGMLCVVAGAIATTATDVYTVTVKECDTSTGTFVTTGVSVQFTGLEDNTTKVARISGLNTLRKRFMRADLTCTGTTLSFAGAASLVLGEKDEGPVNE